MNDHVAPAVAGTVQDDVRPDCVLITVRNPHGGDTCIARARGFRGSAASTNSAQVAAERLADNIYGRGEHTLRRYGSSWTWVATPAPNEKGQAER